MFLLQSEDIFGSENILAGLDEGKATFMGWAMHELNESPHKHRNPSPVEY